MNGWLRSWHRRSRSFQPQSHIHPLSPFPSCDPWSNSILSRTFIYYAAFVAFGLIVASLGPTLPGLAEQTGVPIAQISFLFAARSGGYLTGSILGGRVYDRLPGHPMLAGVLLAMMLAFGSVPLLGTIALLAGVLFLVGIAEGMLDVGGNTMLLWHR